MASKTAAVSWKDLLLPGCFGPNQSTHKIHDSNKRICQGQQRVSLSELSGLISPASLSNLSGSLVDVHAFSLKELETITRNFSRQLGKGGFGPVYKGFVEDGFRPGLKAQVVAVKVLDLDCSKQGHREWLAEVVFLGQLKHPHLVNLMGYCCEDQHRLLVYEYMEGGNLHKHLFESLFPALPWLTRLKIAVGAAKGLAFLHEEEKHVIYRDFKSSNILLDSGYNAKLSDFGFAIDGPNNGNTHVSTRIMGTEGYIAPEYVMTGHLTTMSDVFSFGMVLLELLTGRKAIDKIRSGREKILVEWAKPRIKDPYKLHGMMDPKLEGQYSTVGARKVATLAHQCLSRNPKSRPRMSFVVRALEPLLDLKDIPVGPFVYIVPTQAESDQRKGK